MKIQAALWAVLLIAFACAFDGCADGDDDDDDAAAEPAGPPVTALFSLDDGAGFFDAPFPSEHMRRADGTVKYDRLPNPKSNPLVKHYLEQANGETQGFSRMGAMYLPFDGPIDEANLPAGVFASMSAESSVFLVNVDRDSPAYGNFVPIHAAVQKDDAPYRPANLLMLLPYQGVVLAPDNLYAAVVRTSLNGEGGAPLLPADAVIAMREGRTPPGEHGAVVADAFESLWAWCDQTSLPRGEVATAAVFRTGDFVTEMKALRDAVERMPDPQATDLRVLRDHDTYTIVEGRMTMPIWQDGERSYWTGGGKIHFENGQPVLQGFEEIRFAVSVPKGPMPAAGYPLLIYANGQGGKYTQVFDRARGIDPRTIEGEGPAWYLANRGVGALDIEASTVGPRHPFGSYEGLAFFNFLNLVALRDNVRQAASEFTMLAKLARTLRIPADLIPESETGGGPAFFDAANLFFWGHSTGASIGAPVLAVEPLYRAGMVSGAGVSWNLNLILKQNPFEFKPVIEFLTGAGELDEFHPLALAFQNVADPAETAYYAAHWIHNRIDGGPPPDVFLSYGIFDLYFPPPMIDGLVAATGVDVAGSIEEESVLDALALGGRSRIDFPASLNVAAASGTVTGVAIQYRMPPDLDGHNAAFHMDPARYQYACFFGSIANTGVATVPPYPGGSPFAPCGYE